MLLVKCAQLSGHAIALTLGMCLLPLVKCDAAAHLLSQNVQT